MQARVETVQFCGRDVVRSMSLVAQCSACSQQFQADPAYAGQTLACPSCGGVVQVPMAAQVATNLQQQTPPASPFQQQPQQGYQQPAAYQQQYTQQQNSGWAQPAARKPAKPVAQIEEQSGAQSVLERVGWALSTLGAFSLIYPLFGLQVARLARLEEKMGGAMPYISLVFGLIGVGCLFAGSLHHMKKAYILSGSFAGAVLLGFVLNITLVDRGGAVEEIVNLGGNGMPDVDSAQDALDHANRQMQANLDAMNDLTDQMINDMQEHTSGSDIKGPPSELGFPGGAAGGNFPGAPPNVGTNVTGEVNQSGNTFPGGNPFGNQNNNAPPAKVEDPADSQPFRRPIPEGRKSGLVGSVGGGEGFVLATGGKRLIGVSGNDGSWGGKIRLARFQPYLFPGAPPRGKYTDKARNGYAIGAIEVNYDNFVNALRCTYVKMTSDGPDWSDSYQGEWIGKTTGNQNKTYGGQGEPAIIGVYYRQGLVLNAFGVLFEE